MQAFMQTYGVFIYLAILILNDVILFVSSKGKNVSSSLSSFLTAISSFLKSKVNSLSVDLESFVSSLSDEDRVHLVELILKPTEKK